MSIEQFNKTITSINMINSINRNLGIDNASSSSKVKMIADTLTDEIFNTNQNTQELLSRKYTSTAAGKHLDMNGAEYGVYRTKVSSVSILKNEGTEKKLVCLNCIWLQKQHELLAKFPFRLKMDHQGLNELKKRIR